MRDVQEEGSKQEVSVHLVGNICSGPIVSHLLVVLCVVTHTSDG